MTNLNYSISGLKDLLTDLENLSTCITGLPKEHVSPTVLADLIEQQYQLIQFVNGYCMMLQAIDLNPSLLEQ
ncbi:hypothetical protein NB622_00045 [Vibrio parahaemolyticus]|uniref:hypothetical protein n=1 Tax=Vibrio parahaemolyticus TaxID=670 RepID=UPI001C931471|nr:hypothetical protein [Vibrio parahaemolyticus]MBY4623168.1 hypothetical protein [Vibrio parahaemolyticus]MCR9732734.1 hypothetical protein [Vibrio parahaemolyticus]MDF4569516.1 hypothetical protein [Vibrio parahaemolyticus]